MTIASANDSLNLMYTDIENEMTALNAIVNSSVTNGVNRKHLVDRYIGSQICREVCALYPTKAAGGRWQISDISDPEKPIANVEATDYMRSLFVQRHFKLAAIVANIIGSCILIIDDGLESALPATTPIALHMMLPEQLKSGIPEGDFYLSADESIVFHKSRVLIFHGIENPFHLKGWGNSRLAGFLEYYDRYEKAVKNIGRELADRSIFTISVTGLKRETAIKDQRSILSQFFSTLRKGINSMGLLLLDRETMEGDWKERTFSDVDIPFAELRRHVIANSDIPEMELFGVQDQNGLAEKGLADRLIVATKATELQAEWEPNLIKIKNAIDPNPRTEIVLDNPLQMSPLEEADIELKHAQAEKFRAESEKLRQEKENSIAMVEQANAQTNSLPDPIVQN